MADPDTVPAGRYGRAALTRLGAWPAVAPHVVRAENVRAALALVERGAAPYGIVYATDARASRAVRVAGVFPAASHPPIRYPVARLARGRSPGEAEGFAASSFPPSAARSWSAMASPRRDAVGGGVGDRAAVAAGRRHRLPGGAAGRLGLAWLLARGRFPGKLVLDAAVHLPLVVPPVVTGWMLLLFFGEGGWGGRVLALFGTSVLFRWTGAAIAAGVMALPLMVRAMRLSIEAVDRRLEEAARTLGASRWRVFRTITLPLSLPGVLAGTVLGFARSIGEFGATITFVANVPGETGTLPLAIYAALQQPGAEATVARLAGVSIALSLLALVVSEWLARRMGRGLHVL